MTLGGFCRFCWLSEQGVEPKGGEDLSWRCSFPPNNHPGTKWTFLRQNSKDSAIQKPFLARIYFVSTTLDTPDGSVCISPATLNHHLHCNTFIVAHSQAQTVIDVQATLRREPREQPPTQVMELPPARAPTDTVLPPRGTELPSPITLAVRYCVLRQIPISNVFGIP